MWSSFTVHCLSSWHRVRAFAVLPELTGCCSSSQGEVLHATQSYVVWAPAELTFVVTAEPVMLREFATAQKPAFCSVCDTRHFLSAGSTLCENHCLGSLCSANNYQGSEVITNSGNSGPKIMVWEFCTPCRLRLTQCCLSSRCIVRVHGIVSEHSQCC